MLGEIIVSKDADGRHDPRRHARSNPLDGLPISTLDEFQTFVGSCKRPTQRSSPAPEKV